MGLQTYNDFVKRCANGFWANETLWGEIVASTGTGPVTNNMNIQRVGDSKVLPSLPSGVTAYIPTMLTASNSTTQLSLVAGKLVDLGSLNIATPTFTDGNQMPTQTVLGVSRQLASPIFMEVTTVLNATPGSITITYVDQDGNTSETTASMTLVASSAVSSVAMAILNTGDWGVRDITSATRTGGTTPTGVIKFWGIVPFGIVSGATAQFPVMDDYLTSAPNVNRLGAADVVGTFCLGSNAVKTVAGNIFYVGDN